MTSHWGKIKLSSADVLTCGMDLLESIYILAHPLRIPESAKANHEWDLQ